MSSEDRSFAAVESYFHQQGWSSERIDQSTLITPIDTPQGRVLCIAEVQARHLLVESLYSFTIPESRRMLAAEFAARVNRRIEAGAFTVDIDDGDVGLRTGIMLGPFEWDERLIGYVVRQHLTTSDLWLPGIAAVCFAPITPRLAFETCLANATNRDVFTQIRELLAGGEDTI